MTSKLYSRTIFRCEQDNPKRASICCSCTSMDNAIAWQSCVMRDSQEACILPTPMVPCCIQGLLRLRRSLVMKALQHR